MAIMPNDGRVALAEQLAKAIMHIAWGSGEAWWGASERETVTLDEAGRAALRFAPVVSATVMSADGSVTYTPGTDYAIASISGEIVRMPLGALPADTALLVEYVTGRRQLVGDETALVTEVGRRRANTVAFVLPAESGAIETPDGKSWTLSQTPTRYIYVTANFGFSDAPDATIREVAIFINTVSAEDVPPGQLYLTPEEIADPGRLLLIDRLPPIIRSPAETRSFSYVIAI